MKTRQEQIEYLKNLKDEEIDFSDIPEVKDFTNWKPNPFYMQAILRFYDNLEVKKAKN